MSKRRRFQACSICNEKPAPYKLTEKRGVQIINKGFICETCAKTWARIQREGEDRVKQIGKTPQSAAPCSEPSVV